MQVVGQPGQTLRAAGHDDFRGGKGFAGCEGPAELILHEAHLYADLVERILLGFRQETAAVDVLHRVAGPAVFICLVVCEDEKRIVLVGRHAAVASDPVDAVGERLSLGNALHTVAPVERDQVEIAGNEIDARTHDMSQSEVLIAAVPDNDAAGDDIEIGEHTVQELGFDSALPSVLQIDVQGFDRIARFRVNSREPLEGIFAFRDGIGIIAEVAALHSVIELDREGCPPVISVAEAGIFLRKYIEGIRAVIICIRRVARKTAVITADKIIHDAAASVPVIQVKQHAKGVRHHLIRSIFCMDGKKTFDTNAGCVFMIDDHNDL